ncbi:MAG: hypothetical protein FWC39_00215 [Bacteroidetes bacterium]|nr:hypothetical protein [Bacteroidota bacterium]
MKKLFTTLMLGLTMIIVCPAQTTPTVQHHEFYGGFGLLNTNQMFSMIGDVFGTIFTLGQVQPDRYWAFTPSIGYKYWFNKSIGIGAHFAFDKNSVKANHGTFTNSDWRIHNRYFYTFALDFNWNYMNRPMCQLYGNIGMGSTLVQFSNNKADNPDARLKQFPFFNWHISPFGVRVGNMVGGFAEFGWGYKGFINTGVSVKL